LVGLSHLIENDWTAQGGFCCEVHACGDVVQMNFSHTGPTSLRMDLGMPR
jgi:hypothetical protein